MPMRILLTNDDGITADTLWALHDTLTDMGQVTVVAPDQERSGVGHAITYREPVHIKEVNEYNNEDTYTLSGTPADCVKFGLFNILDEVPDLIVSGINPGLNLGCNVFYSGTVAAAIEGVMNGVRSVAVSCDPAGLDNVTLMAKHAARTVQKLLQHPASSPLGFNVNMPHPMTSDPPIVYTHHLSRAFQERYVEADAPHSFHLDLPYGQRATTNQRCDVTAIQEGNISVTPLRASLTDHDSLAELNC